LSAFEDAEGDHWIGTETTGLHILRRLAFRSEMGLAGVAVTSVVQASDGTMWVGTRDDGVRRLRAGVWREPIGSGKLTSSVVLALAPAADGGMWVGTPDGLNYISGRSAVPGGPAPSVQKITQSDGLPDDSIRSLVADTEGSLWVGTTHGLAHLRRMGSRITVENKTVRDGLGGDLIGALFVPHVGGASRSAAIWVSTSGGLSRVAMDGTVKTYRDKDGLGSPIVTSMAEDRSGVLWAATADGGLSYFDGQRFHAAGDLATNGARANKIEGMIIDGKGALWLRMDRGVRRLAASWLYDCVTRGSCSETSTRYGIADGLPNEELVFGASAVPWRAADGEVWFPTRGGVAVANAESVRGDVVAPPVVVQRLLIDDAAQPLNGTQVSVPFGHSRITIEYVGLSFLAPAEVRYRFMLKGFDERWTEAAARRSATYTNLSPGAYEFVVQAANRDGVWSATGASVRFRVVPPVYRRWWFITLAAVLVVLLLVAVYLLRLRVLRREFNAVLAERNRMAREIHDTLTQDFVGTSLQLDIIGQQLKSGQTEQAMAQVKQTRRLVTDGLEEARRSIWELRADNSQDSLPTRMSRLVQRDTFAAIAPRMDVGGAYRALGPRMEREILRITQEALSNVLRHAEATKTVVELRYHRDALRLSIRDNGRGFVVDSAVAKQGHFGLLGMKERASSIDGSLEIASAPGEGSVVTLNVPLAGNVR
jgi:signal transduction histidine kinase